MMTAVTKVTFRDWSIAYGKPKRTPAYDEAEARRRWEAKESFTVLFGDPDHPDQVMRVELGGDVVVVSWLDEHNREVMEYLFGKPAGIDELFLERTAIISYAQPEPSPTDTSTHNETYLVRPDGTYQGMRGTRGGDDHENTSGTMDSDQLAGLHEPSLVFGQWDSIIRRDR